MTAITENEGQVVFEQDKVYVMKENKKVLEGVKNNKGLYTIEFIKDEMSEYIEESLLTETKEEKVINWHRKLGHTNITSMKKMIEQEMVTGMDINSKDCDLFELPCDVCMKGKQTRLPFNTERSRAEKPLEIIHSDLCGPIDPPTWDNKKYILTVMDDYTHYSVIYLLEYKNETTEYIKQYIAQMEREKNLKVKKIRSDNGGEFLNTDLKTYCKENGIIMDVTIPHTPQLNGKAERLNRTIIEKVRVLLFETNMDKKFWGEAARVGIYILNRSLTTSLSVNMTPYELWTDKKPDLKSLQVFGSEVYSKNLGYLQKLNSRSEKYLFMGYAPTGYRLWDKNKQNIIIRRDVVFKKPKINNNRLIKLKTNNAIETEQQNETENNEQQNETESSEQQKDETTNNEQPQRNAEGNEQNDSDSKIQENEIEYIYEDSDEEDLNLGQGKTTKTGRKVNKPKYFEDYVLLTYNEAIESEESSLWKDAIEEEKESLRKNQTWEYIDKAECTGKRILTNKWVFKIKDDGTYKARLVVRGCQQQKGIDYEEVFSPVVQVSTLRLLFAISVQKDFQIKKFDIKTAFLYGTLNEDIYMQIPEGYKRQDSKVCKLKKSLYGLKQAPMKWNEHFTKFLKENDMESLSVDQCIFKNKRGTLFLAIYVDDGLIVGKNDEEIDNLLSKLKDSFEIKKFNKVDSFLGIKITKGDSWIKLDQVNYTESVLDRFHMSNAKSVSTPITDYDDDKTATESREVVQFPYREAVGSLLYLSNKTRPDIAFAVGFCSRNLENPSKSDVNNVKRILRYLGATKNNGILYKKDGENGQLKAYSDSDFAGDKMTRKSTTGYVVFYASGPISWCSRKQPVVALSSTEAEFIAAAECVKELLYLKVLLETLISQSSNIFLNIDNQSAISIIKNAQFNRRSKHIDVRFHFIHEKVKDGLITIKYLCTENNIADIFTKALNTVKFLKHKNLLLS